jgi:hypothetical protein
MSLERSFELTVEAPAMFAETRLLAQNFTSIIAVRMLRGLPPPDGSMVTIRSLDPSLVLVGETNNTVPVASIMLPFSRTTPNANYVVSALAGTGIARIAISAPGLEEVIHTIHLRRAGFRVDPQTVNPNPRINQDIRIRVVAQYPDGLTILDPLRPGISPVIVRAVVDNPAVARLTNDSISLTPQNNSSAFEVRTLASGRVRVTIQPLDGFETLAEELRTTVLNVESQAFGEPLELPQVGFEASRRFDMALPPNASTITVASLHPTRQAPTHSPRVSLQWDRGPALLFSGL